jgi:hypothetical protein
MYVYAWDYYKIIKKYNKLVEEYNDLLAEIKEYRKYDEYIELVKQGETNYLKFMIEALRTSGVKKE